MAKAKKMPKKDEKKEMKDKALMKLSGKKGKK